jgi:hypothetical protein
MTDAFCCPDRRIAWGSGGPGSGSSGSKQSDLLCCLKRTAQPLCAASYAGTALEVTVGTRIQLGPSFCMTGET